MQGAFAANGNKTSVTVQVLTLTIRVLKPEMVGLVLKICFSGSGWTLGCTKKLNISISVCGTFCL